MEFSTVKRGDSELSVDFNQRAMWIYGVTGSYQPIKLKVELFPYDFHEKLKKTVDERVSTKPRINMGFGEKFKFDLEVPELRLYEEVMYRLTTRTPDYFSIELREQEIRNLMAAMRYHMTN